MNTRHFVFNAVLWTLLTFAVVVQAQVDPGFKKSRFRCDTVNSGLCPELSRDTNFQGAYSGHDEPGMFFYSNANGSGNNVVYHLTLPTDPPTPPRQDGTGGTFNFQLNPAFWFGMVLCDTQSAPNFTHICMPDTDANIFANPDPNAPDFIGHHPGSAFIEMQFYPPGSLSGCGDPVKWCAAAVIFSLNVQELTGKINNADCNALVGQETTNFAFLTLDGTSQSPADPLNPDFLDKFNIIPGKTFEMLSGDRLVLSLHDTPDGLHVAVRDLSTHTTGSMTASIANGFAQVNFDPDPDPAHPSETCSSTPYAFHPMYATSSENTPAIWAAHTGNIGFADEIGHYEYCNVVDDTTGNCISAGVNDPAGVDFDDQQGQCLSGNLLGQFGLLPIGACFGSDFDFDGVPYQLKWPGTESPETDRLLKPTPVRFSSPMFRTNGDEGENEGELHNFSRVAFETDLPLIEFATNSCNRFTGNGCTNPPLGTRFYPIFTTTRSEGNCRWQFGGANIPGTENNFGGSSTTEYGDPIPVFFLTPMSTTQPNGGALPLIDDYRRVLDENPCPDEDDQD